MNAISCAHTRPRSPGHMQAIAWDSAGVTTGPVTVPFVLSIGIGFSIAAGSAEGFGMLTIMSVWPIISVLLTAMCRGPAEAARKQLARSARSVQQSLLSGSHHHASMHALPSTKSTASLLHQGNRASSGGGAGGAGVPTPPQPASPLHMTQSFAMAAFAAHLDRESSVSSMPFSPTSPSTGTFDRPFSG
jgi:hypothetical protein